MDNAPDLNLEIYSAAASIGSSGAEKRSVEIITDRYLNQAIGACCTDDSSRLLTKPIKGLIARYAPSDRPTMNEIPQERRRAFLDELSSITKRPLPRYEPIWADPISSSGRAADRQRL